MSIHQFAVDGRKRLILSPSKTEPGKIILQLLDSARDVVAICSMDANTAAVIGQAFDLEAAAAESAAAEKVDQCAGVAAAVDRAKTMHAAGGCECRAASHVGRFKPPCVCHLSRLENFKSGGAVFSALPVFDVAQVGA